MKILFMNPEATLGGAERSLIDVMWSFRKTRPEIELGLLLGGDGDLAEESAALGVRIFRVGLPAAFASFGEGSLRSAQGLTQVVSGTTALAAHVAHVNRAIREFRPSVIHTNGIKSHVIAALSSPPKLPMAWHVRDFIGARRLGSRLLKALSWRAGVAIANSQAVAGDIRKVMPKTRTRVVLNGIDMERFAPIGNRAELDAASDQVRVGLVATFARWKGQEVFLQAASRVRAALTSAKVKFFVVGGPVYRTRDSQFSENELREMARSLGVDADVSFVPFQKNPADVFRALDVVVHASSKPEPFGRTIVEAMACGRAVIGVAEGGAAEIIRDEENALAIPPRDPAALADAIVRLAEDADLRARLGKAGRADALARFSRDRLAADMLRAYQAIGD